MPITPYLNGIRLDPDTRRVAGIAFECACLALKLTARDASIRSLIAAKIIELAKAGETDSNRLCEGALSYLRSTAASRNWGSGAIDAAGFS